MDALNESHSKQSVTHTPSLSTFQAAVDIETLIRRDKEFLEVKVQAEVGRMTKPNIITIVKPKSMFSSNHNSGIESARAWFRHFLKSESTEKKAMTTLDNTKIDFDLLS